MNVDIKCRGKPKKHELKFGKLKQPDFQRVLTVLILFNQSTFKSNLISEN